jgi:hypothetical protein
MQNIRQGMSKPYRGARGYLEFAREMKEAAN